MMNKFRPKPFFLRSTTAVSLNERFSQVLVDQLTKPRIITLNPMMLQKTGCADAQQRVLLRRRKQTKPLRLQTHVSSLRMMQNVKKRESVWTRLGWQQATRPVLAGGPGGFWSFRNKYRWKSGSTFTSTCRGRGDLRRGLWQSRFMMKRHVQKPTTGQTQLRACQQRGGGRSTFRRPGWNRKGVVPTRRQLDAELDQYMSRSKSRLDQQLDEYMSKSKSRLDAQLDEYMSMAGQRDLSWDKVSGDVDLTWY